MKSLQLDLPMDQLEIVKSILNHYLDGCEVRVFGSRVKGNAKPFSDLDLVIMNKTPISSSELRDITEAFSESDLPIKVDVVVWSDLSPDFQSIIEEKHLKL